MNRYPHYEFSKAEVEAIKLAWRDPAGRPALELIVNRLCGVMTAPYVPGDPYTTAFVSGHRWIGEQLTRAINMPSDKLVKEPPHEPVGVRTATERAAGAYRRK